MTGFTIVSITHCWGSLIARLRNEQTSVHEGIIAVGGPYVYVKCQMSNVSEVVLTGMVAYFPSIH